MGNKIFTYLFLILPFCLFGQGFDKSKDQSDIIDYIIIRDLKKAKSIIDSKFLKSSDNHKKVVGYVYLSNIYNLEENIGEEVGSLLKAKEIANQSQKLEDRAYVNYGYSIFYMNSEKWDLGLDYFNKAVQDFNKLPNESGSIAYLYAKKIVNLKQKSNKTSSVKDFKERLEFAKKSNNPTLIATANVDVAYMYGEQYYATSNKKYLDSIFMYNKRDLPYIEQVENKELKKYLSSLHYIQQGADLMTINKYDESIQYFNKALEITKNAGVWKDMYLGHIYIGFACNYDYLNQWDLAEKYYLKSIDVTSSDGNYVMKKIVNTKYLASVYAYRKNYAKAYEFQVKATDLITKYSEKQKTKSAETIEILKTKERAETIKKLELEKKNEQQQRWLYLGLFIVSLIGIGFLVYLLKSRSKILQQEKSILESKNKEAELTLKFEKEEKQRLQLEQENLLLLQESMRKDAIADKIRLESKDKYLNEIKGQIKEVPSTIKSILKEEKAVDEEIIDIQSQINNIHPNFFKYLKEISIGKLSSLDFKYVTYIYLDMTNYQMSKLLNVDANTVRVNKYRLKQKIGLDKDADLRSFIQSIDEKFK